MMINKLITYNSYTHNLDTESCLRCYLDLYNRIKNSEIVNITYDLQNDYQGFIARVIVND